MNFKTKITNDSEDGLQIRYVVKRGLLVLTAAIIILSAIAFWTITQLTSFNKHDVEVIEKQQKLLYTMRINARERTLLLYSMFSVEELFQRDERRVEFYKSGTNYAQALESLATTSLTSDETALLQELNRVSGKNASIQRRAMELLFDGRDDQALEILREQAIPGQKQIMQLLEKLNNSISSRYEDIKKKTNSIGNTSVIILIVIVLIIISGAIYIIRETTFRTSKLVEQLTETRNALQKTIYELIQQKDTLDHHAIVSITDQKGNIVNVNDKFCEISGYSRGELIGQNHRILRSDVHPDDYYKTLWKTISAGKVWHGKICNRRKDGRYYWVESTISPFLDIKGKPYQYVSVRTDITHLLEAKIEAENASHAKSTFLSSMSHELRTPMNAVIGFAQILELKLKGEQLELVKEISKAGNHLLALINDVLDLTRIGTEKSETLPAKVELESLLNECIKMVEYQAQEKNIDIQPQGQTFSSIHVFADRILLKQVVLNLLSNAIKYNVKDGNVIISVKHVEADKYRVYIEDTGVGIEQEQLSLIFNPFTRLDEHMNVIAGTGIGLTITKRLIENMNGKIGVESEVGKGSVFWVELPGA